MSISLLLLPVALVIRVAMGKDNFDEWVKESELKKYTTFKDSSELAIAVKGAGYDLIHYGGLQKTHMENTKSSYFYWEMREGVFTAVFSKYDDHAMIQHFIHKLESFVGKKIFFDSVDEMSILNNSNKVVNYTKKIEKSELIKIPELPKFEKVVFPTNFTDKDILLSALTMIGVNTIINGEHNIECNIENCNMIFSKNDSSTYELEIYGVIDYKKIHTQILYADEEYKRITQENTYQHVVEKISSLGMTIENETVLEDNSILLTINI